jgi:MFS transporter, DHA1 family, multidrug resistance protein
MLTRSIEMKSLINNIAAGLARKSTPQTNNSDISKARRIILLLAVSVAFIMIGFGIIMPVFARRLEDFGAGVGELSFITMGFAFTQFILSPIMGSLADRIGRRPIILLALGGYAAVNIGFLFAHDTVTLMILRCIEGGITAGLLPAAQATVGDIVPADRRAQGVSMVMAGYGFGFILGPFIGGLLFDMWGYSAPFIASSSMGLIGLVFAWIMVPETHHKANRNMMKVNASQGKPKFLSLSFLPRPLNTFYILMLVSFILTFTFAFISPVMIFYVYDDLKFSATQFGLLVGVYGLAAVLGQVFLGSLSDKFGRKPIIVLGLIVSSVFYVGMVLFTSFATCFLVCAIGGLGSALATSATSANILDISDEEHKSQIQGLRSSFMALGEALGPLMAVFVSTHLTPHSMFLVSTVIGVAAAFVGIIALRGTRQPAATMKTTSLEHETVITDPGHKAVVIVRPESD